MNRNTETRDFTKEIMQMANKRMKRCSIPIFHKGNKLTIKYLQFE